jgi:ubiquinone biosynthesis protein
VSSLLARHVAAGLTPDAQMFTDLFRIVAEHGLSIPPEIAAVFRALATMEGTLTQLAPGFDIITETRRFAAAYLSGQLRPGTLREAATSELPTSLPILRRLPAASTGSAQHWRPAASDSTCACSPTTVTGST